MSARRRPAPLQVRVDQELVRKPTEPGVTKGLIARQTGYYPKHVSWISVCTGHHGMCQSWNELSQSWSSAVEALSEHWARFRPCPGRCERCKQQRMLFPHRRELRYAPDRHDPCPTCECSVDPQVEVTWRNLCVYCWQSEPVLLDETNSGE